eukprot:m.140344 g.140344  ORF g.140344 m.140344 type:complete len:236 (+) comp17660_c0_seq3:170-877(+)
MSCPQQDGYSHHHRRKSLYLHHFKNAFRQTNAYHVQLIPQVPKYADAEVCRDHIGAEVIVQNGPYKSKWLRVMWVNCSGNSDCIDDILAELEDIEKNATGAVYITIPNRAITQSTPDGIGRLLQAIVGRGMTFYTQSSHQDLIWYKWCNPDVPNLVPTYATSIEGAGVLMLSPDETEVLLVYSTPHLTSLNLSLSDPIRQLARWYYRDCQASLIIPKFMNSRLFVCYFVSKKLRV